MTRSAIRQHLEQAFDPRQAGSAAAALVAGEDITQGAAALAHEKHAAALLDGGQLENWEEALANASSH